MNCRIRLPARVGSGLGGRSGVLAVLWWLSASTSLAQRSNPGRIDGVVTDSIHASPLAGALVFLARRTPDTVLSVSATTDAGGRFDFDGLPPGDYVLALESAFLDSLELSLPPNLVTVAPAEQKHLLLAIPSAATLKRLVCPDATLPAGVGAVSGHVQEIAHQTALGGVTVTIGWSETIVDRSTLRATNVEQHVDVKTDSLGRFRICGVPTDTYLDLRASLAAYTELLLQFVIPDGAGAIPQNLSLSISDQPQGSVLAKAAKPTDDRAASGEAAGSLSGTVYGATAPIARVQVQRIGSPVVVSTDSLGRYRFRAVPIGPQVLELRRVGYLPRRFPIEIRAGANTAPDVQLAPVATLDSIKVVAQRPRYREFESRAKSAAYGHFLRAEDIARKAPLLTSDLLRQMPGFKVVRTSTSDLDVDVVATSGPTSLSSPSPCLVKIIIDGVPHQMINWIDPTSIGAMEIYPGTSTGPAQYQSPCGTILIWTKRY